MRLAFNSQIRGATDRPTATHAKYVAGREDGSNEEGIRLGTASVRISLTLSLMCPSALNAAEVKSGPSVKSVSSKTESSSARAEADPKIKVPFESYKPTRDEQKKMEDFAVRYLVRLTELAASGIQTPKEFVNTFLASHSPEERAFLVKQMKDLPVIYRTSPTKLMVSNLVQKIEIDYRDLAKKEVYINGSRVLVQPDKSIQSQWPVWQRKIEYEMRKATDEASSYSRLVPILFALTSDAIAKSRIQEGGLILDKMRRAAERAAEKQKLATAAADAKKAERKVLKHEAAKAAVGGASMAAVGGPILAFNDVIKEETKMAWCWITGTETADCANTRIAKQRAEDMVTDAPALTGGKDDEIAQEAAQYFDTSNIKCREKIPDDPTRLQVRFKREDLSVNASMTYNAAGKAEKLIISSTKDPSAAVPVYKFVEGRLKEVCVPKTAAEIEKEKGAKQQSSTPSLTPLTSETCHDGTRGQKEVYLLHVLLTQRIDQITKDCAATKAKHLEATSAPPKAPEKAPGSVD